MQDYCVQDIETTLAIWEHLKPDEFSEAAIRLEHEIYQVCAHITEAGWPFDVDAAAKLHAHLVAEQAQLAHELRQTFGFWYEPKGSKRRDADGVYSAAIFTPKKDDPKRGYVTGQPLTRLEMIEFNPGSRTHIFKRLMHMGWKPREFTDAGQPVVNESMLAEVEGLPQAQQLVRYLMLDKRLGQLAEGDKAWLKVVKPDGRIHASYNPMGCITSRASHSDPNIAQVPALKTRTGRVQAYGKECRELFYVPEGWSQIGADMSGLEIACLCHYLTPIPKSAEYINALMSGDPHAYHMRETGIADRGKAKTWYYAMLYGSGDANLAKILEAPFREARTIRELFDNRIPTGELRRRILRNLDLTGGIQGLDGRFMPCRSQHSALNTLLQSAGAILCKRWVVDAYHALLELGLTHGWGGQFVFLGWIHDELQVAVRNGYEEQVAAVLTRCAKEAGKPYGFRVSLSSEYKIGRNWAECH